MASFGKVTKSDALTILNSVKTFFFDCDGVLWNSHGTIPGAVEVVNKLKAQKKDLFFVTNNSSISRKEYLKKFQKYGMNVEAHEILPTSYLAARYVKKILNMKKIYMMGSQGMADEFEEEGIEYIGFGPQIPEVIPNRHYALNYDVSADPDVEAVVVGFDVHFNLNKISQAMQYLKHKHIPFIATNTDATFPAGNGVFTPGTGCIVKAVETAVSREATILGKPNKLLYEIAQTIKEINPETTLMIGDRLNTDIAFGKNCGFQTLCVLTGITNEHALEHLKKTGSNEEFPDYIADSIQDLYAGFDSTS